MSLLTTAAAPTQLLAPLLLSFLCLGLEGASDLCLVPTVELLIRFVEKVRLTGVLLVRREHL